jgi:hypothetical protein
MANQKLLPQWVNARASGFSVGAELHVVGEDGVANEYFLNELPEPGTAVTIASRTQQASGDTLAANEFTVDYKTGKVTTHSSNNGEDVSVAYTAIGSAPLARDMDRLIQALGGPWHIDIHPPVAGTPDDEFEASSLDAKWTAVSGSSGTVDLTGTTGGVYELFPEPGVIAMQPSTTVHIRLRQTYTLPDNTSIIVKLSPAFSIDGQPGVVNNELQWGMWLNDTAGAPESGVGMRLLVDTDTDTFRYFFGSFVAVSGSTPTASAPVIQGPIYLRIRRSGTTFHGYFSPDGLRWTHLGSNTEATALTNLWIGCTTSTNIPSVKPAAIFHWVREGGVGTKPW